MFSPSLWLLVPFLMVCPTLLRSFQTPSQLLALMLALGLGALHLFTLHFHLVGLKPIQRLLIWEAFLPLNPVPIVLLLGGTTNLTDKLLLKFCPTPLPPRCQFQPIRLAWRIHLYPRDSHLEEVNFTLWATPNPDPIRLGEIFITLNRTFLLG
jgi:hypothetical protein